MGAITRKYDVKVDCIVTESYIYAPVDLSSCKDVKRVKVVRSLWDTGASVSLMSIALTAKKNNQNPFFAFQKLAAYYDK